MLKFCIENVHTPNKSPNLKLLLEMIKFPLFNFLINLFDMDPSHNRENIYLGSQSFQILW